MKLSSLSDNARSKRVMLSANISCVRYVESTFHLIFTIVCRGCMKYAWWRWAVSMRMEAKLNCSEICGYS